MEITFRRGICGYYSSFSHRQTAVSGDCRRNGRNSSAVSYSDNNNGTKIVSVITNWSSLSVLLSLYLITFCRRSWSHAVRSVWHNRI